MLLETTSTAFITSTAPGASHHTPIALAHGTWWLGSAPLVTPECAESASFWEDWQLVQLLLCLELFCCVL